MNKLESGYYYHYKSSIDYYGLRTIEDAYAKPSCTKKSIWKSIENECNNVHGFGLTVVSKNCNFFSAGFVYYVLDNETGEIVDKRYRHYLPTRTLDFSIDT